jgi:hypothetical protein
VVTKKISGLKNLLSVFVKGIVAILVAVSINFKGGFLLKANYNNNFYCFKKEVFL